jgi:hydrogenase maturation protease
MEQCSPREDAAANKKTRAAIVGLGNPSYGDDGVGLVAARGVYDLVRAQMDCGFIEHEASGFRLAERLVGYQRAVIIDALTDPQAEVGTVTRLEFSQSSPVPLLDFHTAGFQDILALAQMTGLEVPQVVVMYGIAIREPEGFSENLSAALTDRLPQIVQAIAAEVLLTSCEARTTEGTTPTPEGRKEEKS